MVCSMSFFEEFFHSFYAGINTEQGGSEDQELGYGNQNALVNFTLRWKQHRPDSDDACHDQGYSG